MQRLDDLCLLYSSSVEHWHWIDQTVRIPCLTSVDPNRKVPDLYFKVMDPKLQVADLKVEVGELRSGGISNLTPARNKLLWLPVTTLHMCFHRLSSFKITDFCTNRKSTCHFLLIINCNLSFISPSFRDITISTQGHWKSSTFDPIGNGYITFYYWLYAVR